jgi:biotin transporter BioY
MSVVGAPALLFIPKFIVAGDAAATAAKIAGGERVYRLLMLGALVGSILFAVLGWSLYHLFERVDRKQAMLLLVLVLVSATIGVIDVALLSPPLIRGGRPRSRAAHSRRTDGDSVAAHHGSATPRVDG